MKAFLGMGLLGSNFVKAMIKKGDQVQVWNRTAAKAKALEADGAKAFDEVTDAVKGADIIHLTLRDDDTVNEVLEKASAGFKSNPEWCQRHSGFGSKAAYRSALAYC